MERKDKRDMTRDKNCMIKDKNGMTEEEFLAQYQPGDYERPSVAADMVIFTVTEEEEDNYRRLPEKELRVLLIRRGGHPYLGCWALPGGFVRPTETTEQAARRELKEETGLDQVYLEQLYTFSNPGRDPRTWVMSCSYMALTDSSQAELQAGDDADKAAWFRMNFRTIEQSSRQKEDCTIDSQVTEFYLEWKDTRTGGTETGMPVVLRAAVEKQTVKRGRNQEVSYHILENEGLAFDHARILAYALERLQGKLEYTDLALCLMPETFTLTKLQQVYEVIWNKKLLNAAFRRKIAPLVEETESFTENEGHRPSRLYRRKRWHEEG